MNTQNKMLAYYRQEVEHTLDQLDSRADGLTTQEAQNRQAQYGTNTLKEVHKDSFAIKYLRQFKDLMIILLVASSVLSVVIGDLRTGIVLGALIIFNTTIGFLQEFKAERIMESLERLTVSAAKVTRSSKLEQIDSAQLVPGDIVYIEEGDSVPADLRVIEESELSTNDFALTGESNPSRKFTHAISTEVELPSRHNLLFMGTNVATGHGHGVVIATGMQTELGRIASLSADTPNDLSPLQRELNHTATRVTQGTLLLCLILMPVATASHMPLRAAFLFAIGIASSLIPQGLPAEINASLAQAANKLVKAKALVKKLSAVESLGATTVICTDKTGTLTKNEMTVQQVLIGKTRYLATGTGYQTEGTITDETKKLLDKKHLDELEIFFTTGVMASNAQVNPPDADHQSWYCIGDPTEGALITLAAKAGIKKSDIDQQFPEQKEFAFDSARKRMSSVRNWGDGDQLYSFAKGAPESVLQQCDHIWDHGHVRPLTAKDRQFILSQNETLAQEAMRNLGYAYKMLPAKTAVKQLKMEQAESGLTWLGMVSMIDPLRDEVPVAMADAHKAHIKIAIITGDYSTTATAIAKKAGLGNGKDIIVVAGQELRDLDDARVLHLATRGSVIFSRVSPEDKLRIVNLVKDSGHVVAVTGDGINDAPALKRADIGVAMGITGTDVAKQSAEMVLLDDSFHTLVGAVQEGRTIFQNIKKGTLSAFTSNAGELVVNLASLAMFAIFHIPLAIGVMEILAIDLIAEIFPIAALGWDKADRQLMTDQPRNPKDHILNRTSILDLLWCGLLMGGFAIANYLMFYHRRGIAPGLVPTGSWIHLRATGLTYLTIVLCQLVNILQRRSEKGLFTRYQLHNRYLWGAMALSMFCVLNIIYNPWIAPYFGAGSLNLVDWLYAILAAGLFLAIREFQRWSHQNHSQEAIIKLHEQTRLHK
jgi:Ca2+-transporting ATPase